MQVYFVLCQYFMCYASIFCVMSIFYVLCQYTEMNIMFFKYVNYIILRIIIEHIKLYYIINYNIILLVQH